jgi:hypothetical protein
MSRPPWSSRSSLCAIVARHHRRPLAAASRIGHSGRVPLVYVTGISGAGKSAVCHELKRRGYEAHDTDEENNAVWVNARPVK